MSGPQATGRAYWLVLFFVPAAIWLAVFVGLDGIGGFEDFMAALAGACDGALSFLPACGDLDDRQRGLEPVPREFLAASHVVILGATAIALVLAVLMAALGPPVGRTGEKPRERWMLWATAAGIVALLLLILPTPAMRIPSSSAVSLMFCLLGGAAALLVFIKLSELRTRRPTVRPPPDVPPVVRR